MVFEYTGQYYIIYYGKLTLVQTKAPMSCLLEDDLLSRSRIVILDAKLIYFPREIQVSFEQCKTAMRQVFKEQFLFFIFLTSQSMKPIGSNVVVNCRCPRCGRARPIHRSNLCRRGCKICLKGANSSKHGSIREPLPCIGSRGSSSPR